MHKHFFILVLSLTLASTGFAKIYTWKDASGKTIYGDTPPEHNKAKEVETRELTVVPGYKDPLVATVGKENEAEAEQEGQGYEAFNVVYPKDDEAIRANDGNITVSFELNPGLQKADSVFIYLDGKKVVENSKSLSTSLTNLDRGTHSIFAVVRNDNGDVLLNSNTVSFHILRNSIIANPIKQ